MKFRKALLIGGALMLIYKAGEISGHMDCLKKVARKYGNDIFKNHDNIVIKVTRKLAITVLKPKKDKQGA
jgi:hypothetical protein